MDSMEVNYSEDFDYDLPTEQSPPLDDDSMECDFVVEQGVFPRIGDDYQVEIPAVLEKSDYLNHDLDYFLGVSVPITSIKQEGKKLEHEESGVELMPDYGYFVPGCASDPWNEAEKASFLLGLYIFSRNFDCLKQFLESKKMEDIMSFYYGEFYRSDEYRQWSESRKLRKKGVVGQKIFTGLRKQELLSRILPSLSEDHKNATLQVFKTFGEGKIPFEEFIFSIKEIIGISTLVEAIGIGKGKKDLTTMTQEPSKTNQVNPVVRTRKSFSSLTPDEIAKYLNGGHRLSKARSHDLFLEAVLPRLLARGWNAEGPKGQVYNATTGLENNLVFLVPGVKKFSRRKLKRGIDYFDSVSDVLNKVASDPSLLELDNETKSEDEDVDTKKRHCYLQPRATNSTTEGMKFTVVDTCLGDWKPYKVRELSGLSFDDYHKVNSGRYSEIIEELDAVDSDTPVFDDDSEDLDIDDDDDPVRVLRPCPDSGSVLANGKGKDEKTRKVADFDLRNSMEEDNSHNVSPVIKRRRLTACKNAKPRNDVTSMPLVPVKRGQGIASRKLVMALAAAPGNLRLENRDLYSTVDDEPLRCWSSTTENVECDDISNSNDILDSQEGVRIRNSFDLNLPPETENESPVAEQEDEMAKRRGTRNRPPTARALEAVAYGFLSTKTRQKKGSAGNVRKTSTCSRSKRARGEPEEELPDVQMNPVEPITQESQSDDPSSSDRDSRIEPNVGIFRSCLLDENGTSFFSP